MQAAMGRFRAFDSGVSSREAVFQRQLDAYKAKYVALWHSTHADDPNLDAHFHPVAQDENGRETDRLITFVEEQIRHYPETAAEREIWRARLMERIKRYGRNCLRFPDRYLNILLSDDYIRVTSSFERHAEVFDRNIEIEALSQALRNVWVINCLQMFLGRGISLSPSIFAYSMLYPYTDNLLDDAAVPAESKQEICRKLGRRLEGARVEPAGRHERDIYRLVGMIEEEYDRPGFPEVYLALLAIHRAQVRSLRQQGSGTLRNDDDIVDISVEKGGASVLADGYLVTGRLSRAQADFFFGFGVVLQLFDDLQDVMQDLEAKRWTLFSTHAHSAPLDRTASRLHGFLLNVLRSAGRLPAPARPVLEDLIRRNCGFLFLQAVAQNQDLFDRNYLNKLETFCPWRFEYLRSLRAVIAGKHDALKRTVLARGNLPSLYRLLA